MADNQQPATKQGLAATEIDLVQAMRDMTAEFLRQLESFSQDYFARLDRLERSKIALNKRLKGLEDQVLVLETEAGPTR